LRVDARYLAGMNAAVFGVGERGPNIVTTKILEWRFSKILLKRREPLGRRQEVVVQIVWVDGSICLCGERARLATSRAPGCGFQDHEVVLRGGLRSGQRCREGAVTSMALCSKMTSVCCCFVGGGYFPGIKGISAAVRDGRG
jgi:hypothetical protein